MKRMGSDSEKNRQGLWNETERYFDNHIQGLKSLKRHKTPAKSFVWADELKRQFTYTLKPCKNSNTDIPKHKSGCEEGNDVRSQQEPDLDKPQKKKFFSDMNIEKIFVNSEYFKMKSLNGSMSFCSGENGENRWTIETSPSRKTIPLSTEKSEETTTLVTDEDITKVKKPAIPKKTESVSQAEELKILRDNVDTVIQEMKVLNRDFGLVRMDLKTIEKLLTLQKQVSVKSKARRKEGMNGESDKLEIYSDEVEKAAQELRDFVDNNQTLLFESDVIAESPDFDKIINNLHRLSETAYQPKIIQTPKGAKFEIPREIPISLYADGMLLRNTEFRKYTDVRAGLFLRDIEDGFFPSELWPEYPCGVPFQVTDRRCEMFSEGKFEFFDTFPGNGRRLGSLFDGKPSSMVYLPPTKCPDELDKKKSSSFLQEYTKHAPRSNMTKEKNGEVERDGVDQKQLSLKDALFKKLCEKYHDDYLKDIHFNNDKNKYRETVPDFEIHIYGRKPFRLSEYLSFYPSECGILNNCVINLTEI